MVITRKAFRQFVAEVAKDPSDSNLMTIANDDLGYVELLVALAAQNPRLEGFNDDEPLFVGGQINWPKDRT